MPGVVIADDEPDAVHAAGEEASLAVGADRREQGARHDRPAVADLFVAGIEDEVGDLADWPVAPGTELLVEFGRRCVPSLGSLALASVRHAPAIYRTYVARTTRVFT